jgi:hypothetical protein
MILNVNAQIINNSDKEYWNNLIEAIIKIESKGNVNAISLDKSCVGILQIKKVVVDDCNEYLKTKKYCLNDRYNKEKSIEMFILIQKRYNKKRDIDEAIKIWNGGCGYKKSKRIKEINIYHNKVIIEYNKIKGKN